MHGVTHTLDEIRERGVPGFEVEVIGTDPHVDRRLSAVAEVEIPFYAGLRVGVPSLPAVVEALAEGRYDVLHLCSPGPAGVAAALIGRVMGLPIAGSYHTELAAYTGAAHRRRGARGRRRASRSAPSTAAATWCSRRRRRPTRGSRELGIAAERVGRWDRGVDIDRFSPRAADARAGRPRARALRRPADAGEGRRPARRRVPRRPRPRPAAGARARRRRAGGGRAARPARRRRPVSRLARGRRAGARLRGRRPLPLLLADGHLRPGGARGAGLGAPGRRGRRGRPGGADRLRPHRRPVPAARQRARRRRRRPRRLARRPRAARPRRRGRGARAHLGSLAGRARRRLAARDRRPRRAPAGVRAA